MAAVEFAWESQSIRRVGWSAVARHEARLTAVVVFPTPPFWLATAMIRAKDSPERRKSSKGGTRKQDVSRGTYCGCGLCGARQMFHVEHWSRSSVAGADVSRGTFSVVCSADEVPTQFQRCG